MTFPVRIRIDKTAENEAILGGLGFLRLRWSKAQNAYEAVATAKAWCALGQQSRVIPIDRCEVLGDPEDDYRRQASRETLRKFARAAAVADGNAFFGAACDPSEKHEDQYLREAEWAVMVLEGLGVDPDAFAAMFPDPCSCFARISRSDDAGEG